MTDRRTPLQRSYNMSRIHGKNTSPELKVRRWLHGQGFRFRVNVRMLPGSPDIVLAKYRTCIFVNGCFWHGHKGCSKYTVPKTNVEFWKEKVARNQERDLINNQRLETMAWNIITVWECELTKSRLSETLYRVESEIKANKTKWDAYCIRRKQDRQFALEQARKRKEIAALVEAELNEQFHIPVKIKRMSYEGE